MYSMDFVAGVRFGAYLILAGEQVALSALSHDRDGAVLELDFIHFSYIE